MKRKSQLSIRCCVTTTAPTSILVPVPSPVGASARRHNCPVETLRCCGHLISPVAVPALSAGSWARRHWHVLFVNSSITKFKCKIECVHLHIFLLYGRRSHAWKSEPGEERRYWLGLHWLRHWGCHSQKTVVDLLEAKNAMTLKLIFNKPKFMEPTKNNAIAKPISHPTQMSRQWFL